jgi:hypothetical protein
MRLALRADRCRRSSHRQAPEAAAFVGAGQRKGVEFVEAQAGTNDRRE